MIFIPIRGLVATNRAPIEINGFAFEIPGYEYVHTWVTEPLCSLFEEYIVSHWETGCRITTIPMPTKEKAARAAENVLRKMTRKEIEAAISTINAMHEPKTIKGKA